jgi:Zinc-finger double-stranded RNA-binding
MSLSLNDLDAKLADLLEAGEGAGSSDSGSDSDSSVTSELARKRRKVIRNKRRQGLSTLCFNYLKGKCKFSDCMFRHVNKLETDDKLELMNELKRKPGYDSDLALYVKNLNIPVCKQFNKGLCKYAKCGFWHVDNPNIAKWAGFDFYCSKCNKGFTSESQLHEHKLGKVHNNKV